MFRAIICIEEGFGAIDGPNPVFRTEAACEEYWLARWFNLGPQINSYRIVRSGPMLEETHENKAKLIGKMLRMQSKLSGLSYDEVNEMMEGFFNKPMWVVDTQIAVLQEKLWEKKHKVNVL